MIRWQCLLVKIIPFLLANFLLDDNEDIASFSSLLVSNAPFREERQLLDILKYPNIDACSSYLPPNTVPYGRIVSNEIVVIDLPSAAGSQEECTTAAIDWRDDSWTKTKGSLSSRSRRCQSACWSHYDTTTRTQTNVSRFDNNNHCYCVLDSIWMPKPVANERKARGGTMLVDSARLLWECQDDSDCSFNGHCEEDTGRCTCLSGWKGITCGELDLLPVDRNHLGFRETNGTDGQNVSSWGAPILWDEISQEWHGFVSEIQDNCGINAWETNSRIVHIVSSDSPYGPFQRREIIFPAFAHEPSVVRDPTTGEWVMLFSSYRYNERAFDAIRCKTCQGGVTPDISPLCPFQLGLPTDLRHRFLQMMSKAPSPNGPWLEPMEITQLSTGWDWNTDLTIHTDGSAVALIRGGSTWYASNYSNPSSWRPVGNVYQQEEISSQGPGWPGVSVEDPYIWQSNGIYHALAHAFYPFYGVHAYVPIPSIDFNWSFPLNWTVTGIAYDNVVSFSDGTQHSYVRRERPHLIWSPPISSPTTGLTGITTAVPVALSNGVQFTGRLREAYADGVFTLVQPLRRTY